MSVYQPTYQLINQSICLSIYLLYLSFYLCTFLIVKTKSYPALYVLGAAFYPMNVTRLFGFKRHPGTTGHVWLSGARGRPLGHRGAGALGLGPG